MSFFDRFKLTLRADANGLIDAIEEPTLLLKQHLRDAELALSNKQAELARLEAEAKRLAADRQRAEADRARLDRDAELALAEDRDDLARHVLGLLVPKLRLTERIDTRLAAVAEEVAAVQAQLDAQLPALEELRARVQAYITSKEAGTVEAPFEPVTEQQIEIELLRRKAARKPMAPPTAPPAGGAS
ncbi:MAG TPA: PspA/IM30 family protein [Polyangiaceae bacterium]|nr:PspA/IM30 family protein [Polyangiaceae bacterium]